MINRREDRRERDPRIDRHDELIAKLLEQQIRTEEHIQHLLKADERDHKTIEDMGGRMYDAEKILSALGVRLSIVQWFGVTLGGGLIVAIIGYLVTQFLKP